VILSGKAIAAAGPRGELAKFLHRYSAGREMQQTLIAEMIARNAGTSFGREHGFAGIKTVADYQRQVPIRQWHEMSPYVDAMIAGGRDVLIADEQYFYHRTSGTTGKPKMIPFTRRCEAASKLTHRMWIYKNLQDNPGLVKGRIMAILNAGVDGYTERGEVYGSVSGNIYFRMPEIIRRAYSHPYDIYHIPKIEARRYSLLRFAIERNCSFVFTGNPSSLLGAFEFCNQHAERLIRDIHDGGLSTDFEIPDSLRAVAINELPPNPRRARALDKARNRAGRLRPLDYWPKLNVIGCWIGGSMGHFAPSLREWCGETFRFRDVGYMASEGIFSIPLGNDSPDGVLALHGIFFEFIPELEFGRSGARALQVHELEQGQNYHVLITTTGGLYRYAINDVIRVTGTYNGSPTIRFLYKGGNVKNIQGEMVTIDHAMSAISALTGAFGIKLRHFQITVEPANRRYIVHIEPVGDLPRDVLQKLLQRFEQELGTVNENYMMFRADELIGPPCLRVMRQGWFARMSQEHSARGGRDSQFKPAIFVNEVQYPEMIETELSLA
jgi:GH3 auxin-responsive promoter